MAQIRSKGTHGDQEKRPGRGSRPVDARHHGGDGATGLRCPYATSGNTYQYTFKTTTAIPVGYTYWFAWYVQEVTAANLGATTASILVELTQYTVALEDSVTGWSHTQFVRPGSDFSANPAVSV